MVAVRPTTSLTLLFLTLLLPSLPGCNKTGDVSEERLAKMAGGKLKDVVPVSGKVLVDGTPKEGVNLYLYKVNGKKPHTECRTDTDGEFCWSTSTDCDGLEPGDYRLTFKFIPKMRRNEKGDDLFGGRYSDPNTANFPLKVEAGKPQEELKFELSTN